MLKNQPQTCLGQLFHPKPNHDCQTCNQITQCQEKLRSRLKPYVTVDKRKYNTIIDWDVGHFAYAITDKCILELDVLYAKYANEKSEFERGTCSGNFKMPTASHQDFYRELLKILSDHQNLTATRLLY
jgi:hypothetical protein